MQLFCLPRSDIIIVAKTETILDKVVINDKLRGINKRKVKTIGTNVCGVVPVPR
jgi:hypothetical protein